jgi:hypothetical protein
MLIFFIHGVATRTSEYASSLQSLLEKEFRQRQEETPLFHSGYWGHVYRAELNKIWNKIDNAQDRLKHQEFRKRYLSQFVGDAFTYLGSERGAKIREDIANQLIDFIDKHPDETELHIITHSLGTVILWDILFSDKFQANDPAFKIRERLKQNSAPLTNPKINLKSITTMGSPISLFNSMLEVKPQQVNLLAQQYSSQKLKWWLNLIHVSDIIAYPIHPVLDSQDLSSLFLTEKYLEENVNPVEEALEKLSKFASLKEITSILSYAQVAAGSLNAHTSYWKNDQVADFIVNHILEQHNNQTPCIKQAIKRLKKVGGFTEYQSKPSEKLRRDKNITKIYFKDKSGSLIFPKESLGMQYVYILDHQDIACFAGFVGLIHIDGLKQEVELIQTELGV